MKISVSGQLRGALVTVAGMVGPGEGGAGLYSAGASDAAANFVVGDSTLTAGRKSQLCHVCDYATGKRRTA